VLKYGYDPILQLLLANIPKHVFHLGTEVKGVQWTNCDTISQNDSDQSNTNLVAQYQADFTDQDAAPVSITLANNEKLTADYVLFTASVGVLKTNALSMFDPPLSGDKLAVIDRMGFGTVDKIYLEYDQPFWDKDYNGIQLAWLPESQPFVLHCLDNEHVEEV
jgi:monoamine oxidase